MVRSRILCLGCVAALLVGCAIPRPAAKLPSRNRSYVAVLSGEMPPPLDRVARHSWIVTHVEEELEEGQDEARVRGGSHRRFELGRSTGRVDDERWPADDSGEGRSRVHEIPKGAQDPFQDFAAGDVMLHGVIEMSAAELEKTEACLEDADEAYYREYPGYLPLPGPNSNTFVAYLLRKCDLGVELPASAIGRDYVGIVGAQLTEGGTGIQLGTWAFGLRVGLKEGIEVHLFGLPLGVHFWPPGINVPVNPGRIGFATDGHKFMPHAADAQAHDSPPLGAPKLAVVRAVMAARGQGVLDSARAGGQKGQLTVGLGVRGLYGGRIGYGYGLDFALGASAPLGFAGSAHVYPLGVGLTLPASGYLAWFGGLGTSGATGSVPAGLELPQELRLAFDAGRRARVELFVAGTIQLGDGARRTERVFDERAAGLALRVGKLRGSRRAVGSGSVFGVEVRELLSTTALSLTVGTEIDFGM